MATRQTRQSTAKDDGNKRTRRHVAIQHPPLDSNLEEVLDDDGTTTAAGTIPATDRVLRSRKPKQTIGGAGSTGFRDISEHDASAEASKPLKAAQGSRKRAAKKQAKPRKHKAPSEDSEDSEESEDWSDEVPAYGPIPRKHQIAQAPEAFDYRAMYRRACKHWEQRNNVLRRELKTWKKKAEDYKAKFNYQLNDLVARKTEDASAKQAAAEARLDRVLKEAELVHQSSRKTTKADFIGQSARIEELEAELKAQKDEEKDFAGRNYELLGEVEDELKAQNNKIAELEAKVKERNDKVADLEAENEGYLAEIEHMERTGKTGDDDDTDDSDDNGDDHDISSKTGSSDRSQNTVSSGTSTKISSGETSPKTCSSDMSQKNVSSENYTKTVSSDKDQANAKYQEAGTQTDNAFEQKLTEEKVAAALVVHGREVERLKRENERTQGFYDQCKRHLADTKAFYIPRLQEALRKLTAVKELEKWNGVLR